MNRPYPEDKLLIGDPAVSLFDAANEAVLAEDAIPYVTGAREQLVEIARDIESDEMPDFQRTAYRKAYIAGVRFVRHAENFFADAGVEPDLSLMASAITELYDPVIRSGELRFPTQAIPALTSVARGWTHGDLFLMAVNSLRSVLVNELAPRGGCSDPDCPTCGPNAMPVAQNSDLDPGVKDKLRVILDKAAVEMDRPTIAATRRDDVAKLMADVMSGKVVDDPRLAQIAPGAVLLRISDEDTTAS